MEAQKKCYQESKEHDGIAEPAIWHCGPYPLPCLDLGLTDQTWKLMPFTVSILSQSHGGGSQQYGVRDIFSDVQAPYEELLASHSELAPGYLHGSRSWGGGGDLVLLFWNSPSGTQGKWLRRQQQWEGDRASKKENTIFE